MKTIRCMLAVCFLVLLGSAHAAASDWSHWRGPWQTGASPEKDLPATWSDDPKHIVGSNLIWRAPYGCRSTPLIMNGRVYIINHLGDKETVQERVMCLDADTGKFIWQHNFNVFYTDIVTVRLGWTVLAGDPKTGNVYAHGTQGLFFCFDKDGKVLWSRSLTEEYGRISGYGGRVTSPTVAGDLVIIGMLNSAWGDFAKGSNRFLAMNKLTGEVVWWADIGKQPKGTYYSVPVTAVINGQALLITGTADGSVYALKLNTGEIVWGYHFGALAINCSPVVDGNYVYIGHGEENPDNNKKGRIVCLDASKVADGKPALVWSKDGIKVRYSSPIVHEGRLYIADEVGKLFCFDAKTGKQFWKYAYSSSPRGSPVLGDGKVYVTDVGSKFLILEAGDKECKTLDDHFFPAANGFNVELTGSPAIANGRVYFSTSENVYCIGKKGAKPGPEPAPLAFPEKAASKIAHLQVLPADIDTYPGDTVTFKVKAFDENGIFIKEVTADKWSLPTPPLPPKAKMPPPPLDGKIADGKLTIGTMKPSQQGYVLATVGDLTGKARVRVVPKLPYVQDFSKIPDGAVPGGWVNTQGKFVVKTLKDGNKVLAKVNTNSNPLIARGNAFIGLPTMTDYTIECDVQGTKVGDDMPDVGINANRYTLVLAGNIQKARLVSWDVLPRIDSTINYAWKPGVWYRLKLTVEFHGKTATAKGKVWEAGQPEPAEWTLTAEDPRPNTEGSPGLYGYVAGIIELPNQPVQPGTEIYYDNLRITSNKTKSGP